MIIGLGHQRRQGKDAVADILVELFGFRKMSFTMDGRLHEACLALDPIVGMNISSNPTYADGFFVRYSDAVRAHGYEGAKDRYPEVVRTLQRMGTEVGRNIIDKDLWVNFALDVVPPQEDVVFTNVRFANEAAAIKRAGGVCWKVVRPGYEIGDSETIAQHDSETSIDDSVWSVVIVNDGTLDDLRLKVLQQVVLL